MKAIAAFGSTLLIFLMASLPTASNAYGLSKNTDMSVVGRRAFVAQGIAFSSAAAMGTTTRVAADDGLDEKKESDDEKPPSKDFAVAFGFFR